LLDRSSSTTCPELSSPTDLHQVIWRMLCYSKVSELMSIEELRDCPIIQVGRCV
jgi:hypothetical protein